MTREHKLALIVGFSLVLLVGVLISDHLSRARQARVEPVQPAEAQVVRTDIVDPLRHDVDGGPLREAPPPVRIARETAPAALPPAPLIAEAPAPAPQPERAAATPAAPPAPERTIARAPSGDPLESLEAAILAHSGTITPGEGGIATFTLPAAAGTILTAGPAGAAPATSPLPRDVTLYTVKKGDTLSAIAERVYGTSRVWRELAKYNNLPDGKVVLGTQIKLPGREALGGTPAAQGQRTAGRTGTPPPAPRAAPAPPPRREVRYATYTVRRGDTLGQISQKVLGTSRRTQEIVELNDLDDEDLIPAGTVLKVPVRG